MECYIIQLYHLSLTQMAAVSSLSGHICLGLFAIKSVNTLGTVQTYVGFQHLTFRAFLQFFNLSFCTILLQRVWHSLFSWQWAITSLCKACPVSAPWSHLLPWVVVHLHPELSVVRFCMLYLCFSMICSYPIKICFNHLYTHIIPNCMHVGEIVLVSTEQRKYFTVATNHCLSKTY